MGKLLIIIIVCVLCAFGFAHYFTIAGVVIVKCLIALWHIAGIAVAKAVVIVNAVK